MRDCLVLGSGRSGTSMLGGILHGAGYFMGEDLYPPRFSNPKGFFENAEINGINEEILSAHDGEPTAYVTRAHRRSVLARLRRNRHWNPGRGQRWLCALPPDAEVADPPEPVVQRIRTAVQRRPFAYKDPRFSYTWPVWRRHVPADTVLVCVFRAPGVTVRSVLEECAAMPYLADLRIDEDVAFEVYRRVYERCLDIGDELGGRMLFVHYRQVADGTALPRLSEALDASLDSGFVDRGLERTMAGGDAPESAAAVYDALCRRAGFREAVH